MTVGATISACFALEVVHRFVYTSNNDRMVLLLSLASALLVLAVLGSRFLAVAILRTVKGHLTTIWFNRNLESSMRATIFSMQAQSDGLGQMAGESIVGAIGKFVPIKAEPIVATFALALAILLYRRVLRKLDEVE